jgi:hypothetical protein
MTKRNAMKWVNALRSGKYQQTSNWLQDETGHCCLGVACELFIKKNKQERGTDGRLKGSIPTSGQPNAPSFLKSIERYSFGTDPYAMRVTFDFLNDEGLPNQGVSPLTFDEIADIIQAEFVEPNQF